MPPPSPPDACLNSPGAPSSRSPTTYRARSPAFFDNVWASAPSTRPSAEKRCDKNRLPPQKGSTARRAKNEKVREAQKNGNEPSHDETFPHRTYIEMKKLSQNGKSKWESRIGNLFDYPFDTAKVHTKVESTKYISSFFHTNRERPFAFFPSARALSIGSSRKTYTSLTTPGLYFISSRKCKIAQSAIYQKISRRLKLFLNIMFVKSPPQQFSVDFFCSPPTFFSSHAEKNIILSPLSRRHPPSVDRSPGIFFYSPPLLRARRPDWQAASVPVFPRWARNCASLLTAHRTLPRRARKTGSRKGKIGGFRQKTGVFR